MTGLGIMQRLKIFKEELHHLVSKECDIVTSDSAIFHQLTVCSMPELLDLARRTPLVANLIVHVELQRKKDGRYETVSCLQGISLLIVALEKQWLELVGILLRHGANPFSVNFVMFQSDPSHVFKTPFSSARSYDAILLLIQACVRQTEGFKNVSIFHYHPCFFAGSKLVRLALIFMHIEEAYRIATKDIQKSFLEKCQQVEVGLCKGKRKAGVSFWQNITRMPKSVVLIVASFLPPCTKRVKDLVQKKVDFFEKKKGISASKIISSRVKCQGPLYGRYFHLTII